MDPLPDQQIYFQHNINHSFVLRRNARIKSSKLPHDFFNAQPASALAIREVGADLSNRDIKTPSFRCRSRYGDGKKDTIEVERKVETARASIEQSFEGERRDNSLNVSKKVQRRSLGRDRTPLKAGYSVSIDDRFVRLPKILHRSLMKQMDSR